MLKKVLLLTAVLLMILPAAAFDYGGSFDVSGGAAISDTTTVSPSVKLTDWVKFPFKNGSFSAEAFYRINSSFVSGVQPSFIQAADVSLLKLTFSIPAITLNVNMGRYAISDVTGSVFSMTSDGLNVSFNAGLLKIGLYGGYTGYLNSKTTGLYVSWKYDADKLYTTGPKYAVFIANVSAPNFFGGNTFAFEGIGALNMNGKAQNGVSDGYSRFYGTASAAGPITTAIYYSTSITGSYLTTTSDMLGVYGKGSIVCYVPFKSLTFTLKAAAGSKNFQALTYNPCSYGGLNGGLSITFKPVDSILFLLSGDVYGSVVKDVEFTNASWQTFIRWQIVSDVSSFLSVGQNIPLNGQGTRSFSASVGGTVSF